MKRDGSQRSELTEYERGYVDALWGFGIWKDGQVTIGAMQENVKDVVKNFLAERAKTIRELRFYGQSDDLIECYDGDKHVLEVDAWNKASGFVITDPSTSEEMVVMGAYSINNFPHSCWLLGVSNVREGEPVPDWPVRYETAENGYSPVLIIEAPNRAMVRELNDDER